MRTLSIEQVFELIKQERCNQDLKWGSIEEKNQSLAGFLLTIESELKEAKEGWQKNKSDKHCALQELIQVAATCFAALEQFGSNGNG